MSYCLKSIEEPVDSLLLTSGHDSKSLSVTWSPYFHHASHTGDLSESQ